VSDPTAHMRVLVTGSRTWTDETVIADALTYAAQMHGAETMTVVHGGCEGADLVAHRVARRLGAETEPHPADWRTYGKRAGYLRNKQMVDLGADLCLAFVEPCVKPEHSGQEPHGSHGASMCADLAEAASIPTIRVGPQGEVL
jgi:SLOG family YspA-like protein